jgi:hypothetical protein
MFIKGSLSPPGNNFKCFDHFWIVAKRHESAKIKIARHAIDPPLLALWAT